MADAPALSIRRAEVIWREAAMTADGAQRQPMKNKETQT
jgi:hypothetical protein